MAEQRLVPNDANQLLLAATYLEWWRDGTIADAEPPEDINTIIGTLQRMADQIERGAPDDWESGQVPMQHQLPDDPRDD
jgi:hypothetical protein